MNGYGEIKLFQGRHGGSLRLPVLTKQEFDKRFGVDSTVPKTEAAIFASGFREETDELKARLKTSAERFPGEVSDLLRLSQRAVGSLLVAKAVEGARGLAAPAAIPPEPSWCGQPEGAAAAAPLLNPSLAPEFVEASTTVVLGEDNLPTSQPKLLPGEHFVVQYWTDEADPSQNADQATAQATLDILETLWSDYSSQFRAPALAPEEPKLLIRIFDVPGLQGYTLSNVNFINLDAPSLADPAKRRTLCAHELFHRVQYAYGYRSLDKQPWASEGSARHSERFMFPDDSSWMDDVDSSFENPNFSFTSQDFDYGVTHFWVYLGRRLGDEKLGSRLAWSSYVPEGRRMRSTLDALVRDKLRLSSLGEFACRWQIANRCEELNRDRDFAEFGYDLGGMRPLAKVGLDTDRALAPTTPPETISRQIFDFGAHFHRRSLAPGVAAIRLRLNTVDAGSKLGLALVWTKGNDLIAAQLISAEADSVEIMRNVVEGAPDSVTIIVVGTMLPFDLDPNLSYPYSLEIAPAQR